MQSPNFPSTAIDESMEQLSADSWLVGQMIIMPRSRATRPIATSWEDEKGTEFCIQPFDPSQRPATAPLDPRPQPLDSSCSLRNSGSTNSAVWQIVGTYCKVKMIDSIHVPTREAQLIDEVTKAIEQIPCPKVIHSWVTHEREYLITKAIPGETLEKSWPRLSQDRQRYIAWHLAYYCYRLSERTQDNFCGDNDNKHGVLNPALQNILQWAGEHVPLRPLSLDNTQSVFSPIKIHSLIYTHANLDPTNIIIHEGAVKGIVGWSCAGYYPRFWLRFSVNNHMAQSKEIKEWASLLDEALAAIGFTYDEETIKQWRRRYMNC